MNLKNLLIPLMAFSLILTNPVSASYVAIQAPVEIPNQIEARKLDREAQILNAYLAKYNSPMQYHAQDFVDAAKEYNLDWKLLPSIAGVESTFGKHIPGGYNAYGWGIYGSNRLYFKSWRDGMFTVAKGLRENYVNKGLNNPYQMNRVYAASPLWGGKVTYFMNDLGKFASQYEADYGPVVDLYQPIIKIAVISGQVNPD
ncbi:MAG: hypothetical protein Q8P92_03690 [Candidatus Daviesbacteria bacterium]|nr:hypothetical protein [Candidatus Daviesbacteria bacterium]